jgi:hypothetical protein
MQFTELTYEMQRKVLDRIGDAMLKEQDEFLQFAMASAMVELEVWCNAPIPEPRKLDKSFLKPMKTELVAAMKEAGMPEASIQNVENTYVAQASDPEVK